MNIHHRLRYWLNLLGFTLLAVVVIFYPVLSVTLAWLQTRPLRHAVPAPSQVEAGFVFEEIAIQAADGITLRGWYIPPQNGSVIMLFPGYGGDRRAVQFYARFLSQAGFGVLMMDPRATGESEGQVRAYGWTDWADGTVLVEELLTRPEVNPSRLGVFGCSTGAEIALGSAALEPRIGAIIADAPYYADYPDISMPVGVRDWLSMPVYPLFLTALKLFSGAQPPMTLVDTVAAVAPRPMLLIAGGQSGGGYEARQAAHFYAQAGVGAELWVIPEAEHCGGPVVQPDEYPRRVVSFFKTAFRIP